MAQSYGEEQIQTLEGMAHLRARSGMYIGAKGDGSQYEDGIYVLFKEVVDNSIDEHIMGHGRRVEIGLDYTSGCVRVRDYGRGIPLGKVVDCVSILNTGGKFNGDAFKGSVGMNGVGVKAVNALSADFEVRSFRDGEFSEEFFKKGVLASKKRDRCREPQKNGTYVCFTPDVEMFEGEFQFKEEHVERRLMMYAYLNAGLVLELNGKKFVSQNGLLDLVHDKAQLEKLYKPFHYRTKTLELVFTHTARSDEDYYSFVNGQYTSDGGTHLSAFKEGLLKAVNEFSKKKFDGDDVREGIIGAIAIRREDAANRFEGQTKNKFVMSKIRAELVTEIKRVVEEMFHREPAEANKLIGKIEETSRLRAEKSKIKIIDGKLSRSVSVCVPKLKDCKHHLNKQKNTGLDSMIFIVEGESAAGTIASSRDVNTQAIFPLKGKSLNVMKHKTQLYDNKEVRFLMQSLNIVETVDRLRYQKVILATDADVDGLHIRLLLITLFVQFFDRVIRDGHLYILETPLFRVRNKKETHYCYTDEERENAIARCGKSAEITRFKGLGEINAKEFKEFIGKNIRLTPVDCTQDHNLPDTIKFYMGENTPKRRKYIMDKLVISEDSMSE